ncbi:MAG TPA: hypothetical protein VHT04_15650 [Stellaceae bacterium]|nr:hypothetical protein [Stellaceae bacterium]
MAICSEAAPSLPWPRPADGAARSANRSPAAESDGHPVSALRLCASARLVVEAAAHGVDSVIDRVMAALDKTALLAAAIPPR